MMSRVEGEGIEEYTEEWDSMGDGEGDGMVVIIVVVAVVGLNGKESDDRWGKGEVGRSEEAARGEEEEEKGVKEGGEQMEVEGRK